MLETSVKTNRSYLSLKNKEGKGFGFFKSVKNPATGKYEDEDTLYSTIGHNIVAGKIKEVQFQRGRSKEVKLTLLDNFRPEEELLVSFQMSFATRDFLNKLLFVKTHFGNLKNLKIVAYLKKGKDGGAPRPYVYVEVVEGIAKKEIVGKMTYKEMAEVDGGVLYKALHAWNLYDNDELPETAVFSKNGKPIMENGKQKRDYTEIDDFFFEKLESMFENEDAQPVLVGQSVEGDDDLPF